MIFRWNEVLKYLISKREYHPKSVVFNLFYQEYLNYSDSHLETDFRILEYFWKISKKNFTKKFFLSRPRKGKGKNFQDIKIEEYNIIHTIHFKKEALYFYICKQIEERRNKWHLWIEKTYFGQKRCAFLRNWLCRNLFLKKTLKKSFYFLKYRPNFSIFFILQILSTNCSMASIDIGELCINLMRVSLNWGTSVRL